MFWCEINCALDYVLNFFVSIYTYIVYIKIYFQHDFLISASNHRQMRCVKSAAICYALMMNKNKIELNRHTAVPIYSTGAASTHCWVHTIHLAIPRISQFNLIELFCTMRGTIVASIWFNWCRNWAKQAKRKMNEKKDNVQICPLNHFIISCRDCCRIHIGWQITFEILLLPWFWECVDRILHRFVHWYKISNTDDESLHSVNAFCSNIGVLAVWHRYVGVDFIRIPQKRTFTMIVHS